MKLKVLMRFVFVSFMFVTGSILEAQLLPGFDFVGDWKRADAEYRLEVLSVDNEGHIDIHYYNPNDINVEAASIRVIEGMQIMTVVLRDSGYPGSTYELIRHPEEETLVGSYMMPDQQQRFEVTFLPVGSDEEQSLEE